jgi:hypothetical protein
MEMHTVRHAAGVALILAVIILLTNGAMYAGSEAAVLPTGATITPDAAPGATFQTLTVDLPDYPNHAIDGAQTTALSPDGKTLLILTSGFNKLRDANGAVQPQDSSEYVFVYDISSPSVPVQKQVVLVPNAFGGLVWVLMAPGSTSRVGRMTTCIPLRRATALGPRWERRSLSDTRAA